MSNVQSAEQTLERIRQALDYRPDTGVFYWRKSTGRKCAGQPAGTLKRDGYISIRVGGVDYQAHRLAWLVTHGCWPAGEIDHRNTLKADNRIANLRDVTRTTNQQNKKTALTSNKSSGLLGVSWMASVGRWRATIRVPTCTKPKYLGTFATKEQAHLAYVEAKRLAHDGCTI